MSDSPPDDFLAPPAFKAAEALATLKRHLRDLRLIERAGRFEWNGSPLIELTLEGDTLRARSVKKPARSPEWTVRTLKSSAEVRAFTDPFKRQLALWKEGDE